jgi:hypothetical protein
VSVAKKVNVFDSFGVGGRRGFNFGGRSAHDDVLWLLLNVALIVQRDHFFFMNCHYERRVVGEKFALFQN